MKSRRCEIIRGITVKRGEMGRWPRENWKLPVKIYLNEANYAKSIFVFVARV